MNKNQIIESELHKRSYEWGGRKRFCEYLYEKYGGSSYKSWEMAVYHYDNSNPKPIQTPQELPEETQEWTSDTSYWYDADKDQYMTFLRSASDVVVVPGETHRAMKEAYSNMVGKPATINEIARDFGFPRNWFDEYRRKHGWTHDTDPYTDEVIAERDVEELVDDLVLRKRKHLHQDFEKRKWKDIEADAEAYRKLEYTLLGEFRELLATHIPSEVQPFDLPVPNTRYALVISPTDFHWGKHGWVDEVGETYDFDEAKKRLMQKTIQLISKLPGKPDKIYLASGSDWFHVDNDNGATTRGTPQDMCGSPAQILMSGCELAREHIELLRKIAPVDVLFMPGNHDRHSSLALMMYLSAVYENVPDVRVEVNPRTRQYALYGNTLIGFTHGDSRAVGNLPAIMANEKRELWGQTEFHVWFHGHKHHQTMLEKNGALVIQLPSLAGHDRYHARQGYVCSKAGLAAHIIDKSDGLVGSLFCPVKEGEK